MMKRVSIAAVLISSAFAGDAPSSARCVFYRDKAIMVGRAVHVSIKIDATQPVHKLPVGRYWETEVTPGSHLIYGDAAHRGRVFNLESGKTYYFRMELYYGDTVFSKGGFRWVPVEPEIAAVEMHGLKADK